jgi:RNA polymerase sigma factor (sigma-70 family)
MEEIAFNKFYNQYKKFIWNLTSKYFQDNFSREDVFQEVFLKIYIYYQEQNFNSTPELQVWLYRITINTAINYFKKFKRAELLKKIFFLNKQVVIEDTNKEDDEAINYILSPLNARQKAVVILRECENLSYIEISKIMNMKHGTVKSTLNRAKVKMKIFLQGGQSVL